MTQRCTELVMDRGLRQCRRNATQMLFFANGPRACCTLHTNRHKDATAQKLGRWHNPPKLRIEELNPAKRNERQV